MKVSELIKKIIALAEEKFEIDLDSNPHDTVNVFVYFSENDVGEEFWQVGLFRPIINELDLPETSIEDMCAAKSLGASQIETHYFLERPTLMSALHALYELVDSTEMNFEYITRITPDYNV